MRGNHNFLFLLLLLLFLFLSLLPVVFCQNDAQVVSTEISYYDSPDVPEESPLEEGADIILKVSQSPSKSV